MNTPVLVIDKVLQDIGNIWTKLVKSDPAVSEEASIPLPVRKISSKLITLQNTQFDEIKSCRCSQADII